MINYIDNSKKFLEAIEKNTDENNSLAIEFYNQIRNVFDMNTRVVIIKFKSDDKTERFEGFFDNAMLDISKALPIGDLIFEIMNNENENNRMKFTININQVESCEMKGYRFKYLDEVLIFQFWPNKGVLKE